MSGKNWWEMREIVTAMDVLEDGSCILGVLKWIYRHGLIIAARVDPDVHHVHIIESARFDNPHIKPPETLTGGGYCEQQFGYGEPYWSEWRLDGAGHGYRCLGHAKLNGCWLDGRSCYSTEYYGCVSDTRPGDGYSANVDRYGIVDSDEKYDLDLSEAHPVCDGYSAGYGVSLDDEPA